jgi:hypothetical protein
VLVVPVLPSLPPKMDAPADELELFEYQTHALMSIATVSGCCQVMVLFLENNWYIASSCNLLVTYLTRLHRIEQSSTLNCRFSVAHGNFDGPDC